MAISVSRECRELLSRQGGVLARWQAAGVDLASPAIDDLLRADRWRRLYRGVYLAHASTPSRESALWAAVLRCGPDAALSYFTAAELDGLRGRRTDAIHVTIPHRQRVRLAGTELCSGMPRIVVHRSGRIFAARHPGKSPPRTRIEETVLDLVEQAQDFDAAFAWLCAACAGRLVLPARMRAAVALRAKMRWRSDVLIALDEVAGGVHSLLERRFCRNVERPHGLPSPTRQPRWRRGNRSAYLDIHYPEFGVVVEVDGIAWHLVEDRWQDIHRDNRLAMDGIITLRYSWADVTGRPCEVAAEIAAVLRKRGWTGRLRGCGACCVATRS